MNRLFIPTVVIAMLLVVGLLLPGCARTSATGVNAINEHIVAPIGASLAALVAPAPAATVSPAATAVPAAAQGPAAPAAPEPAATQAPVVAVAPAAPAPAATAVPLLTLAPAALEPAAPAPAAAVEPGWNEFGGGAAVCPDYNNADAKTIACPIPAGVSLLYLHSNPLHLKVQRTDGKIAMELDFPKSTMAVIEVAEGDTVYITTSFNPAPGPGHYDVNVVAGTPVVLSDDAMAELWMYRIQGTSWNNAPVITDAANALPLVTKIFGEKKLANDATTVAFYLKLDGNVYNVAP